MAQLCSLTTLGIKKTQIRWRWSRQFIELPPVYAVWLSITNYNVNYKQQRHTTASDTLFTRYSTAILHPYLINSVTVNHHFLLLFPSYLSNRSECDTTHKRRCIVNRNDAKPGVTSVKRRWFVAICDNHSKLGVTQLLSADHSNPERHPLQTKGSISKDKANVCALQRSVWPKIGLPGTECLVIVTHIDIENNLTLLYRQTDRHDMLFKLFKPRLTSLNTKLYRNSWKALWSVGLIILDFKLSPCFESCMYSFGYFPGVRLWFADVSEPSIS